MSQGFVNLENLIPGERYSFEAPNQGPGRVQGTFDKAIVNPVNNATQYMFSDMLNQKGVSIGRTNFGYPPTYPRNIIHLPNDGTQPTLPQQSTPPDYDILPPHPPPGGRGGKSRKNRKSKRHRNKKSKRRHSIKLKRRS
jgi:hypothetical protein